MNMKRWLTATLALILILTQTTAGLGAAWAEEGGIEPYVGPATYVDAEWLTVALEDEGAEVSDPAVEPFVEDVTEAEDGETLAAEAELTAGDAQGAGFALDTTAVTLLVSGTHTLTAKDLSGADIPADKLTFKSGATAIAKVNAQGVVTAVKAGSVNIDVTYNGQTQTCAVTIPKEPTKLTMNIAKGTLGVGETFSGLSYTITPEDSASYITWSSSSKVATVDQNGFVTAVKAGTATITAKSRNGKKATCKVTVKKAPTALTLEPAGMKLGYGGATGQIAYTVPSGFACGTVTYSTNNPNVATVDQNGVVTSHDSGSAVITVTAYNGVFATCPVTVLGAPSSVRFSTNSINVGTGETKTVSAVPYDSNGNETLAGLTYTVDASSANPKCVSVTPAGEITGLASGSAVIRATSANGATATCAVSVVALPTDIKLGAATVTLGVGMTQAVGATLVPPAGESACSAEIEWVSSKPKIVSIDQNGLLTAVKTGTSVITATTSNGKKATCKVTVKKAPTKVTLKPTALKLGAGGMSDALTATLPSGSVGTVSFTSSDTRVATVNGAGVVTSVGEGTATITATTNNGKTATCAVTVYGEPGRVTLSAAEMALGMGDKGTLKAAAATAAGNETLTTLTYFVTSDSPNPGCVTIDAKTGVVTAVSKGVAYINARTHNGVTGAPCKVTVKAKAKSLTMPSKLSMGEGESHAALEAIMTYQDGEQSLAGGLTWTTSGKKIVAVDEVTGALTALKKGSCTITAKASNGMKATCKVTVTKAPTTLGIEPATVSLSAGGMQFQLVSTVTKGAAADVAYTSSNTDVVRVSATGLLTTVGVGRATVTGRTYNGLTASVTVNVTGTPVSASFGETSVTLSTKQSVTPAVNVKAADGSAAAADLSFRILSGAQYIDLNTETGEITGVAVGTSVVGVTTHNGVSGSNTYTVRVVAVPTKIAMTKTSATVGVGESYTILPKITAVDGANTALTWSSSNAQIASVNGSGVVTGLATGSATITAKTVNGLTANCKVTVSKAPSGLSLSPASGTLSIGQVGQYKVKAASGTVGSVVTYKSSNPSVASVDADGVVTGVSAGTVTITATVYNGMTATATLTVKDKKYAEPDADYSDNDDIENVIALAESQLGMPYVYAGGYKNASPKGFDCSGLVYWAFYYGAGIKLKDSSYKQGADNNYEMIGWGDLRRGDVVCFTSSGSGGATGHTGIYLGKRQFIHASSAGNGVIITSIDQDYYTRNFLWGRRIIDD